MDYLIVSDTHGDERRLRMVLDRYAGKLAGVLHLGDSHDRLWEIEKLAGVPVYMVKGNCDTSRQLSMERILFLEGIKILMTHGHCYHVYSDPGMLVQKGIREGCDLILYGHTHCPTLRENGGITVANPGSISLPIQSDRKYTYMILSISESEKKFKIIPFSC